MVPNAQQVNPDQAFAATPGSQVVEPGHCRCGQQQAASNHNAQSIGARLCDARDAALLLVLAGVEATSLELDLVASRPVAVTARVNGVETGPIAVAANATAARVPIGEREWGLRRASLR